MELNGLAIWYAKANADFENRVGNRENGAGSKMYLPISGSLVRRSRAPIKMPWEEHHDDAVSMRVMVSAVVAMVS